MPFQCNHDGTCDDVRLCCIETEMTLTRADMERIDELGYDRAEYVTRTSDGFCQLRNINGACFFYDRETRLCVIYESRPEGCRYYPIVYDVRKRKCIADRDCPSRSTVTRDDIRDVCYKVRRLVETLVRETTYAEGAC